MLQLSQIVYSCRTLYIFRTYFPSIIRSSKLRIQQRHMSKSCCYSSRCLTYTVVVYAVLSSWWWTERPSEICWAFYKNKQYEIKGTSCWLYYRNILWCTALWILNINYYCICKPSPNGYYHLLCKYKNVWKIFFTIPFANMAQRWIFLYFHFALENIAHVVSINHTPELTKADNSIRMCGKFSSRFHSPTWHRGEYYFIFILP
jgi:hypothetical protein